MADAPGAPAPAGAAPAAAAPAPASLAINTPAPAAAAPAAAPVANGDWTTGFSDDLKGYVANKGYQNPAQLADAYRNLEKLRGVPQERLLQLPENMDTPEGRAVWEKLGAPKTPQDYGLDKLVPKEGGDPKLAEWAAGVFHENGLPIKAAEKIMTKWNERMDAAKAASKENFNAMILQGDAVLKKEWGAAYDQNVNLAKAGMRALELDGPAIDTLERLQGREKLFKTLQKIGAGVGEAGFVPGRPAADGALAPEQARQKIAESMRDPLFSKRYLGGDTDAKNQMQKWHQMAYPGEFTL